MPTPTSRLALLEPIGADTVSELRLSSTNHATTLDAAVIVTEGTLTSRPSSSLVYGQTYYATDTGLWYFYNGSAWQTVSMAPTVFTGTGNYANTSPSTGRGATSTVWTGATTVLTGSMVCATRPYVFTFRSGFIGVDLTLAGAPIYGLQFRLKVDGSFVTLDDGSGDIAYPIYQFSGQSPIYMFNPNFTFTYTPSAGSHTFAVVVIPDNAGASAGIEGPYELIVA